MKVESKRFVWQTLFEKASMVLPTKDTMPLLKNFQVEAAESAIHVIATDLELSIMINTEMVTIAEPGTAIFPGRAILDIVKEAEDGDMIIHIEGNTAHISVDRAEWNLQLQDGADYPPLPDLDTVTNQTIDRGKFFDALYQVRYAAALDGVRPNMMMIDIKDGKMRAADGVRFQEINTELEMDVSIPIGAIDDLSRLMRTSDQEQITIGDSENHLIFRIGGDTFVANKLTVMFPDVEGMLKRPVMKNDQPLEIDKLDLIKAIRRVRVTADQQTSIIILALANNKCTVKSRDKMQNSSTETIEANWQGEDREIAVNHLYLMDMLNMSDAKSCSFLLGPDTGTRRSALLMRDEETGLFSVLNQARIEYLSGGASSGDSDFRNRQGGGNYETGKGVKDERHNAALQMMGDNEPADGVDGPDSQEPAPVGAPDGGTPSDSPEG